MAAVHGAQWRPALSVQRGHLVPDQLRVSRGSRLLLGEAFRGRAGRTMRLAQRSIRIVMADRADHYGRADEQSGEGRARHDCSFKDGEARYRETRSGIGCLCNISKPSRNGARSSEHSCVPRVSRGRHPMLFVIAGVGCRNVDPRQNGSP